ncbi:hypothetical protein H1C71_009686 [Ictidomys tridecemlineatus]|nr:hypothetical protein H1C71_009686 [Ictidomys tridecemlineatus]
MLHLYLWLALPFYTCPYPPVQPETNPSRLSSNVASSRRAQAKATIPSLRLLRSFLFHPILLFIGYLCDLEFLKIVKALVLGVRSEINQAGTFPDVESLVGKKDWDTDN